MSSDKGIGMKMQNFYIDKIDGEDLSSIYACLYPDKTSYIEL